MSVSADEQKLLDELDETYPESWNFKDSPGPIVGTVIAQRVASFERDGQRKQQKIAVLEADNGTKATVWMTGLLLAIFSRENVQIGDKVALRYEGMKAPEGGGNDYHNFTVRVQKPAGAAVDWGNPEHRSGRRATDPPAQSGGGGSDADFQGSDDDIPF